MVNLQSRTSWRLIKMNNQFYEIKINFWLKVNFLPSRLKFCLYIQIPYPISDMFRLWTSSTPSLWHLYPSHNWFFIFLISFYYAPLVRSIFDYIYNHTCLKDRISLAPLGLFESIWWKSQSIKLKFLLVNFSLHFKINFSKI